MTTDTATRTDAALLRLMWLASPALPVGGFSYSEGLEAAVEAGLVRDEASAADWLVDQLHLGLAEADLAVVAQAVPAWRAGDLARVRELDAWVRRTRESSELRLQAEQMGRSLADWARSLEWALVPSLTGDRRSQAAGTGAHPTYPVAFAGVAAPLDAPGRDIILAFAFGWAENLVQAAIKAVPLGQAAGQRILQRLAGEIPAAADHALALDDDARQCFTPRLAILSARHETQYSRLFRS